MEVIATEVSSQAAQTNPEPAEEQSEVISPRVRRSAEYIRQVLSEQDLTLQQLDPNENFDPAIRRLVQATIADS